MLPAQAFAKTSDFVIEDGVLTHYYGEGGDVTIPDGVTALRQNVFKYCNNLTHVTIPDSVITIGDGAFGLCSGLTHVTIGANVTTIGEEAFKLCSNLTSVIIPNNVTTIGARAFDKCSNLTSVTIGDSVTSIGTFAFSDCSSLIDVTIPDNVTSIGAMAFSGCSNLTSVSSGNSIATIEEYTFQYCSSLTNVTIGNSVITIGQNAFEVCSSLACVTIPNSVTSIGRYAFYNCDNLIDVIIPDSVTAIRQSAFNGCSSLKNVYYGGNESQWKKISVDKLNEPLTNATIHYNSTGPETPDPPVDPDPSGLTLISSTPANGAESVNKHSEFVLTFSGEISKNLNWSKGAIRFVNYETDEIALEINGQNFYQQGGRVLGATLILDYVLAHEKLVPGTYSVLIDEGVILASELNSDGTLSSFSGINDKDELVFTIPPAIVEVPSTTFYTYFDEIAEPVEWNDGWFQYPASTYIHKLAIASAALSNAAYSIDEINYALDKLNFEDVTSQDYEWSTSSNGKAGYTFAHKRISIGGKEFTLVAIVVRGSKNTADWLSNFLDSGMIDGDSGFEDAAIEIIQALKRYCAANRISSSDNLKFLVTGHSRGGIIANIVAAELSTQSVLDNVHLARAFWDNVFGYTFASPRPSTGAVQIACSNIWNIINYPDIVPDVPINHSPRYGTDLFLPNKKYYASHKYTGRISYADFSSVMKGKYASFTGELYVEPHWNEFIVYFTMPSAYLKRIASVHSIVAYYSWLSSYEADELFDAEKNPMYKELRVACPVDVYVYDEAGTLVASIVNDEVVVDNLEAAVVEVESEMGRKENVKIVYLPIDQEYSIEIKATNEGIVSYTVRELEVTGEDGLNETLGTSDRVLRTVSFDNIEITYDDVLTGKVDDPFSIPAADYALTKNGEETIYATSETPSFTDVEPDAYYADAVAWAVKKSITTGTSATTFSPNDPCTRAQIVTFLWRAAGSPKVTASCPFTDVSVDSYYYDAVLWAVEQGITSGTSATTFGPNAACTRAQAVTFLYRYKKSPAASGSNTFTDVVTDTYYSNAVQWAVDKNVTAGTSATTFSPNATCTRGQIVTFLYRDMA